MEIDRRQFVILSSGLLARCALAGAAATSPATSASQAASVIIDAGDLQQYRADGIYDAFAESYDEHSPDRYKAFFIVHRAGVVYALWAVCPHKGCVVQKLEDGSLQCPCHDSTFDDTGKVHPGCKAKSDLPRLAIKHDANGHLLVDVRRPLAHS